MGLLKDTVKPIFEYVYPSERAYFDDSKSTLGNGQVTMSLPKAAVIMASLTRKSL